MVRYGTLEDSLNSVVGQALVKDMCIVCTGSGEGHVPLDVCIN